MRNTPFSYNEKQAAYLAKYRPQKTIKELTAAFNKRFDSDYPEYSIKAYCSRKKIKGPTDGRFNKRQIPWNAGLKGLRFSPRTEFKKGDLPSGTRPIGSERIDTEGYHYIKTGHPNKWQPKHVVLWQQHNGPRPEKCTIMFVDGNKNNITIENLTLVSRGELALLNKYGYSHAPEETKPPLINLAKLMIKTKQLENAN